MDKSLKEKAVDIKGKAYVQVSDRILYFNETYPNGSITTQLLSKPEDVRVVVQATVVPDIKNAVRFFTGLAQEVVGEGYINKTSALENAETSAVGRALALMGIGVIESIASVDEINKANNAQNSPSQRPKVVQLGNLPKCTKCGSEQLISKSTGKPYCKDKCWLNKSEPVVSPNQAPIPTEDLPF